MPPLNWSHFKPEYSVKPDENAEAHLLRTNDWMDTLGRNDYFMHEDCFTSMKMHK